MITDPPKSPVRRVFRADGFDAPFGAAAFACVEAHDRRRPSAGGGIAAPRRNRDIPANAARGFAAQRQAVRVAIRGLQEQRLGKGDLAEAPGGADARKRGAVREVGDRGKRHRRRRERDQNLDDGKPANASSGHRTRKRVQAASTDLLSKLRLSRF